VTDWKLLKSKLMQEVALQLQEFLKSPFFSPTEMQTIKLKLLIGEMHYEPTMVMIFSRSVLVMSINRSWMQLLEIQAEYFCWMDSKT